MLGDKGGIQADWDKGRISIRTKGVSADGDLKFVKGDWMEFYRRLSRSLNEGT